MSEQSSYCPFVVGQHVVCVRSERIGGYGHESVPAIGCIYTIRDMFVSDDGYVCLRLKEIVNRADHYRDGFIEPGFTHTAFRPAPSIAALTELLNKAPVKEDAYV